MKYKETIDKPIMLMLRYIRNIKKQKAGNKMSKSKVTKEPKVVNVTSKVISKVTPALQVIIALLALMVILGLAVKGASGYLGDITADQKLIASVVIVVLLAYATATGLRRLLK